MTTRQITSATAFDPENRRLYLGGTDISAICGFNTYKTCYEVWLEKTGRPPQREETPADENDLFIFGHLLEPVIALEWLRRNPLWEVVSANEFTVDPEFDFLCSNTDRVIRHTVTGELAILEAKTVASAAFKTWKLGIPYTYYTQGQHYLGVSGYDRVIYACLVMDSRKLETFEVIRDDIFIEEIRTQAVKFWDEHVLTDTPPDKTAFDWSLTKAIDEAVIADATDIVFYNEIKGLKAKIKGLKEELDTKEDCIKVKLADNKIMKTAEGDYLFTWNGSDVEKLDSKKVKEELPDVFAKYASTSYVRRFLTKGAKE